MEKPNKGTINGWAVIGLNGGEAWIVVGKIAHHAEWEDGEEMRTSPLVSVHFSPETGRALWVETQNSRYFLGDPIKAEQVVRGTDVVLQ